MIGNRQNVPTYLTPDEHETVKRAASLDRSAVSAWIRRIVLAAARRRARGVLLVHAPSRPCGTTGGDVPRTPAFGLEVITCDACRRALEEA